MFTTNSLGEHVVTELVYTGLDIGGTNTATIAGGTPAQNHWRSMTRFGNLTAVVVLGPTWNAGDSVLTVTIQQAKDAIGTGLKTLKTFTIVDGDLDAAGDSAVFEVQASELDVANDFTHVRVLVAATDNVGVDNVSCIYQRWNATYNKADVWAGYTKRYPQDQAAD